MAGHTSIIHLKLDVNGELFKITHLGPGYFRLQKNPIIPTGRVKIHKIVDGNHDIWEVQLDSEVPADCSEKVFYSPIQILQDSRNKAATAEEPVSA